ncbi:MAG: ribonuclease HII [Ignavibacteria bacterium]|nr:ribonuclease HII [Ignavibacteria bacterium]MBT8381380.1 ribonuclease HII [Ignavibacteria bacterium]MBT8391357.1 ribonuclease HII [Ignavibacteria bacterium]NNJ53027.1 ribonuclease HII [Ignavibacteriaceae bacterium]NNL21458.1 ribonuclease HII [Ignavibacteriaceae bacterium]
MKAFEKKYYTEKVKLIAGIDEAGRGPLAGPVVAAAVVFEKNIRIKGINDSKQLSEKEREKLFDKIILKALTYSVSAVEQSVIDEINILNATMLAMKQAVESLKIKPDLVLVDGNRKFQSYIPIVPIVRGDSKSFSIAAASIIAKVTRDRLMKDLSVHFPQYLWAQNKGYPTKQHREIIKKIGASPIHRKTFLKNILNEKQILNIQVTKERSA